MAPRRCLLASWEYSAYTRGSKCFGKSVVYGAEALAKNSELVTKGIASMMRVRPGKVSGGESLGIVKAGDPWMRGTHGNVAKIPKQIADKLRG